MLTFGYIADGVLKMLLASALCIWLPDVEDFFLSPRWLVIAAAVLLFLSGATEISYGARRAERSHLTVLLAFDALAVVAAGVGIVLALGHSLGAGFVFFGLLGLGSLGVAIVFTTGVNGPDFGEDDRTLSG